MLVLVHVAPAHGAFLAVLSVGEGPSEDARPAEQVAVCALTRIIGDQETGIWQIDRRVRYECFNWYAGVMISVYF